MTAGRWLSERVPAPPAELSAAISRALSEENRPVYLDIVCSQLLAATQRLLPRVVGAECNHRSSALDLLTLDSLITYAMEAASESSAECESTASDLLATIGEAAATEGTDPRHADDPAPRRDARNIE